VPRDFDGGCEAGAAQAAGGGNGAAWRPYSGARMAIAESDFGNIYNLLVYPTCCIANSQAVV
jgi:hypothetical protein